MNRSKEIVRVSVIGIIVNLILVAFKITIGVISNSIAFILDGVNNLTDAFSSIVTILGTKLANRKPDKKHPYGYGQIEYITSVTISLIILFAGVTSLQESINKIIHPESSSYSTLSLVIIFVAVIVKLLLGRYVKSQGEKLNSESLIASGTDAVMDSIISFSTIIAALVYIFFNLNVEGWLGALISIVIIKAGLDILKESLSDIIGNRTDSELAQSLKQFIAKYPNVRGVYDLSLHQYGPQKLIGSVHVELPDQMTAKEIDTLTRKITLGVYKEFGIVLTIGIYASNVEDSESEMIRDYLDKVVKKFPKILQVHGFYVNNSIVSFDLIIDFSADRTRIRDEVLKEMKSEFPTYNFNCILDDDIAD